MQWYVVVKTINGRKYLYRQKTYRVGRQVKTINQYIGPYDGRSLGGGSHPDLSGATTLPIPFPVKVAPVNIKEVVAGLIDPGKREEDWETPWSTKSRVNMKMRVVDCPAADALIRNLSITVTGSNRGAFYSPGEDIINIPPKQQFYDRSGESATGGYYSTLFHELVHWTKGASRTGREREHREDGYAREELVAELGGQMLMRHFGLSEAETVPHATYFQIWLARTKSKQASIRRAEREAAKAVQYILDHGIISK
jgi:hypothetical protein